MTYNIIGARLSNVTVSQSYTAFPEKNGQWRLAATIKLVQNWLS